MVVPGYVSQSIITPEPSGEGKGIITGKILCADGSTPLEVTDPGFVEIAPGGVAPIVTGTGADGIYSAEVDPGIYKVSVKMGEGGYVGEVEGIIVEGGQTTGGVDVVTSRVLTNSVKTIIGRDLHGLQGWEWKRQRKEKITDFQWKHNY